MIKGEIAYYQQFRLFRQCFPHLYIYVPLVRQNAALCRNGLSDKEANFTVMKALAAIQVVQQYRSSPQTLAKWIKVLNTLEWHLSREPMKEMSLLKK